MRNHTDGAKMIRVTMFMLTKTLYMRPTKLNTCVASRIAVGTANAHELICNTANTVQVQASYDQGRPSRLLGKPERACSVSPG